MNLVSGYDANRRANLDSLTNIGGQERAIGSEMGAEDYAKWQMGQAAYNPWMGYLSTVLGAQPYGIQSQPGILGATAGLMTGAGDLMSAWKKV
jgi:hypothetical protein